GPFALYLMGVPVGIATWLVMPETEDDTGPVGGTMITLLRERPRLLAVYGLLFAMLAMMYSQAIFLPPRLAELGVVEPFLVSLVFAPAAGVASLVGLVYARIRRRASHLLLLRVSMLC